jgi:transcriptional regulator with XRE-family HTH domain
MKEGIENHPALRLGKFLRDQRIGADLGLREASRRLGVLPSLLSELERGIGDNLSQALADKMQECYQIDDEGYILEKLCDEVSRTEPLAISDIYDEDDVLPIFIPLNDEQRKKFLKTLGFK